MSRRRHPLPALPVMALLAALVPTAPGWAVSIETLSLDGLSATRAWREWEHSHGLPRIPIVALTAGAFNDDVRNCHDAGMDDFLAKPLRLAELTHILSRWLARPADAGDAPSPGVSGTT